jgi:hypothetical protein
MLVCDLYSNIQVDFRIRANRLQSKQMEQQIRAETRKTVLARSRSWS